MNKDLYSEAYTLVRNINSYRESQQRNAATDENELDENYYRVDDKPKDGRGPY